MSRKERTLKTARLIESLLPEETNPGWFEIIDTLDMMNPREQLECLLEALEIHDKRYGGSGIC